MKAGPWFMHKGHWVRWLEQSPAKRASACDHCMRRVLQHEPRLQVDNDKGPERKRGKGKKHTYLCSTCGKDVPHVTADQLNMFEDSPSP